MNSTYEKYIEMTFELALKATGLTSPNPLVGCVIVKDEKVISTGFHKKSGCAHAELDAINNCSESLEGAVVYCNLEPCCHTNKKTPPCAQRLIKEKVSKVVICNLDPNPEVSGQGVKLLEDAGVEVIHGVLKEKGLKLNEIFFHHIIHKSPFIQLKTAQTLDGFTADENSNSKWITNELSRAHVHSQRDFYDAILIGANTARVDDPSLTVRVDEPRAIKRIVLSKSSDLNIDLKLFSDIYKDKTFLVLPKGTKTNITENLIYVEPKSNGDIDLNKLMQILYKEHMIRSIYVEGGASIHSSFIKEGLYNRISFYIAPKILGQGQKSIKNIEINNMQNALRLKNIESQSFNGDILVTGLKE